MLAQQRSLPARVLAPLLWLTTSLLFHFPLSPLWNLGRTRTVPRFERAQPPALLAEIPVDTVDQPPGEAQPAALPAPEPVAEPAAIEPSPAEATPAEPEASIPVLPTPTPKPPREKKQKSVAPTNVDAGVVDAAALVAPDAGVAAPDAGARGSEPLAMLGSVRSVNSTVANVRLQIENERLRDHPFGARVAALLAEVDGWRDLLRPGGLDPGRDIARLLVAAPSLENTAGTVAILEHHVSGESVRALIDRLVAKDAQGGWLDGGAPRARADAEGLPRHVIQPSAAVVVLALQRYLPAHAYSDPELGLRPLDENVVALGQLEKPWRAARTLGLTLPRSIRWLRGRVELTASGALIEIEAEDESADFARRDAEALTRAMNVSAESVVFEASEVSIHGKITLTEAQGLAWLEGLRALLTRAPAPAVSAAVETARPGGADPAPEAEKPASVLGRPAIATDPP